MSSDDVCNSSMGSAQLLEAGSRCWGNVMSKLCFLLYLLTEPLVSVCRHDQLMERSQSWLWCLKVLFCLCVLELVIVLERRSKRLMNVKWCRSQKN